MEFQNPKNRWINCDDFVNNKCLELNGAKNLEFNSMALPRHHYLLRVQWSEKSLSWNLNLERYKKKWSFRYGNSAVFGEYFGPRTTRASAHVWNVGLYPIHKTTISAHSAYFLFYFFYKNNNNKQLHIPIA